MSTKFVFLKLKPTEILDSLSSNIISIPSIHFEKFNRLKPLFGLVTFDSKFHGILKFNEIG